MRLVILLLSLSFLSYSPGKLKMLYSSIHPNNLASLLAFYTLFPDTKEGENAKKQALALLNIDHIDEAKAYGTLSVIHKDVPTDKAALLQVGEIGQDLPNRSLPGYQARKVSEITKLDTQSVDLSKGLLIINKEDPALYLKMLDIMTKAIQAKLPENATKMEKMQALSEFIFYDLEIRFPPQNLWKQNIEQYTFLPSVIDQRQGVCLGVCALYLALAQRIDLSLEIITPPGHIYVRLPMEDHHFNIETTARGVHLPDDRYLTISMNHLQERTYKQTLGLVLVNAASVYLHKKEYEKAIDTYERALVFLPKDAFVYELLGISQYLFGQKQKAQFALTVSTYLPQEHNVVNHTMASDLLNERASNEAMEAVLEQTEENLDAVYQKKLQLENFIHTYPNFHSGLFHLAICDLQLGMFKAAAKNLLKLIQLDASDPNAFYYLTVCFLQMHDYQRAWYFLNKCKELKPQEKQLWQIEQYIKQVCPVFSNKENQDDWNQY